MGTVAEAGAWTGWVSSELEDLLDVGVNALESCEVTLDLMETIGMTVLLQRGQSAHSRVEQALKLLSAAADAWQDAVDAVAAIDPAGAGTAGATALPGPAGTARIAGAAGTAGATAPAGLPGTAEPPGQGLVAAPTVSTEPVSPPGSTDQEFVAGATGATGAAGVAGATGQAEETSPAALQPTADPVGPAAEAGRTDPAGATAPTAQSVHPAEPPFAGPVPSGTVAEMPTGSSTQPVGAPPDAPEARPTAAVDAPGAAPSEQARHNVPDTASTSVPVSGAVADGPGTADPEAAGAGAASPAGVSGPGVGSRWDRVRDRIPFHGAPVHGTLREWGFTERAWKKTSGDTCELSLTPAAGHVPYSDPVNDVFWVTATDDHGTVIEGQPLFSTRDRLAGPEHNAEPSARQALKELVEDKGLPSALSAGTKYGAATGMTAAAGFVAADGGHTAATVMSTGTGVVAGGIGLTTTWAARTIVAKRRGKIRDPSAPRTVRFTRPLDQMKNLHIHVRRGDHPRGAREAARADTLTLLDHHARQFAVPERTLRKARARIKSLPGFPREQNDQASPNDCQQAVLMHAPEGREKLVRTLLKLDNNSGKG